MVVAKTKWREQSFDSNLDSYNKRKTTKGKSLEFKKFGQKEERKKDSLGLGRAYE